VQKSPQVVKYVVKGEKRACGAPESREEQAYSLYCENARFQEILRENKRKTEIHTNLRFFLSDWT